MYRVMIVDDEPEIRMGLRLKVDWDLLGLTVAAEASNGVEALEKLEVDPYDIVVTDMNMPAMNGVSLLEACRLRYPQLKLIVITGYEDFHYAHAALKSKVRDYLLKPVSQDELTEALSKVVRELEEARSAMNQQEVTQWRMTRYFKEMKEHFLVHLVKEEWAGASVVQERSKWFQLDSWGAAPVRFLAAGLPVRAWQGTDEERTPDKLRLPFELIGREFAESWEEPLEVFRDPNYPGLLHAVIQGDLDSAQRFARAFKDCVSRQLAYEPVVGVGEPVLGFEAWKEGYLSALLAWNMTESRTQGWEQDSGAGGKVVLSEDTAKIVQKYLLRGEFEQFRQVLRRELGAAFSHSGVQFVKLIFQLYVLMDTTAHNAGVRPVGSGQLWIRPGLVHSLNTVEKAEEFLMSLGTAIMRQLKSGSEDAEQSMIEAAQQYIQENYMYEISLSMLAERFNYHPTYFSELFKAKVGTTFIQYVTDLRMKQAVHLLEDTGLGLADISELTGFSNASYFSSKFKKLYGMSPSDYRQQASEKFNNEEPKK
ncbi:response regulator transcription factor [Paenibacillus hexagrammi]|uniref:Response regulator n=1 Tax=Paenibacillus hexagrammi TaxID=2908839 RepID=A0ABY3SI73_9BACL|nr:response regulator [Paenibacillus sp. YPD9-1]UJF33424.1 response regulator [Paenibacillus sp. YPD9-1]